MGAALEKNHWGNTRFSEPKFVKVQAHRELGPAIQLSKAHIWVCLCIRSHHHQREKVG